MSADTQSSLKSLWQTLPTEKTILSKEQLRQRANKFQIRHKRKIFMEYIGFAGILGLIAYNPILREDWKAWLASGLAVLGGIIMLWNYNRFAKVKSLPAQQTAEATRDYMRRELTRQRDAAASAWKWYILPITPFFLFVLAFRWIEEGTTLTELTIERVALMSTFAFAVAVLVAIILWQFLSAARYQRHLDILDN